jgi:hypothetical protein
MKSEVNMASQAKIAAAIQNGQKSTGPKTEEGKKRSRMNALKHGMTAKTVLLPEENPAEFKQLMVGWFDSMKPQDQSEASLVERAAYTLWQIDRVNRAQSARLRLRADSHADDEATRVEQEVIELANLLFRAPHGRPAALPCALTLTDQADGNASRAGTIDIEELPAKVISRMMATGLGCRWLLELWSELRISLENAGWKTPERFRAFRLLGIHASNSYMNRDLASILQACQAIDPDAGSLAGEVWNECVPKDALPALEAQYQREVAHLPALDQDAGRKYLLTRIEQETTFIAEKLERHEEKAAAQQELSCHLLAFDDSREGRLLQRYEHSCTNFFLRCLDELHDHREERAEWAKQGLGGRYFRPAAGWFEEIRGFEEPREVATSEVERVLLAQWETCRLQAEARERENAGERDEVQSAVAETAARTDAALAAERQECRSHAGAWEREEAGKIVGGPSTKSEIRNPKVGEEAEGGPCTKSEILSSRSQILNSKGDEEVDGASRIGAEIGARTGVALAAEQQECRSHAGAWERDGGEGEDVGGAPTSVAEISSPSDDVRSAERDERAAMEGGSLAAVARRLEPQLSREVEDGACVAAAVATNGKLMSHKERKRRNREERKRIRELSVVSGQLSSDCPLSVV